MPDLIALLEHIEGLAAEQARALAELRAAIAEAAEQGPEDDFSEPHLLEISTASARFNRPPDTLRLYCRQGDGRKIGGRWLISAPKLRRRLRM